MALMAQFQIFILAYFGQTTNYCCFGNYERPAVFNALISTSLAVKGLFHLANFIIANLEQGLAPIVAQALAHSFVTKCHSRKHWNNLFWLMYGNNNKEFYWVYLFCKHMSVLRYDFEFNNILFPKNCFQSKSVFILKVIISSSFGFFNWCKCCLTVLDWFQLISILLVSTSCTSTCSTFAIAKFGKSSDPLRRC